MFDALKDFLRTLGGDADAGAAAADDPRVAAAALLFHVSQADGIVTEAELARLHTHLKEEYGLDAAEARRIADAGRQADADAVDLYRFTSVLMNHLGEEQRIGFVELLWDVTYADGAVHELEDNLIWRVAELLGVSSRARMLTKRDAALRNGGAEG